MAKRDLKPDDKEKSLDLEELLLQAYSAVEVPCTECFGRGWRAQGRITHVCGACLGSGAVRVAP